MGTTFDFERNSGLMAEGIHYFRLTAVEEKDGPKATYFEYTCTCEERSDDNGKDLPLRLSLSAAARWKLDEFLDAVGAAASGTGQPEQFLGLVVRGSVAHSEYENRLKAEIVQVLPSDIAQVAAPPPIVAAVAPAETPDLPSPQLVDPDPNAAPF